MRNLWTNASIAALALASSTAVYAQETTAIIRGSVATAGTPVANAPDHRSPTSRRAPSAARSATRQGSYFRQRPALGRPVYRHRFLDCGQGDGHRYFPRSRRAVRPSGRCREPATNHRNSLVDQARGHRDERPGDDPQQRRDFQGGVDQPRPSRRRAPVALCQTESFERPVSARSRLAGTNPRFNRFTINGAQVGDSFELNPDASPTRRGPVPYDALDHVTISVADTDIRQSNFQGGVISTTLLAGTNDYHVNGFYSLEHERPAG